LRTFVDRGVDMPLARRTGAPDLGALQRLMAVIAVGALAATALLGTWAALVFIVAALALMATDPFDAGRALLRYAPFLLIPLLAMLSTIWSDAPQRTLRAGMQLLLTVVAAMLVARNLPARTLVLTLFAGFLIICLCALPFLPRAIASGQPAYAPFESKNALGFAAHFLFALALAVLLDGGQRVVARLVALGAVPLSLGLAWLSASAGAQLSFAITLIVFPALLIFGRLPFALRIAIGILLVALLVVAATALPSIEETLSQFRSDVLRKDATLTGRTHLWEVAARLSAERPWFGYGYYAFWRQGNIEAEGLWRWGGIASRTGFNFHNAFVEMRIDMGLVGMALLIATCAGIAAAGVWRQLRAPSPPMAFFLALIAIFYSRSFGESGLIGPFSLITALWIVAGCYAFLPAAPTQRMQVNTRRYELRAPRKIEKAGRQLG
jgi:exopolysaccharide production protein ExoQ